MLAKPLPPKCLLGVMLRETLSKSPLEEAQLVAREQCHVKSNPTKGPHVNSHCSYKCPKGMKARELASHSFPLVETPGVSPLQSRALSTLSQLFRTTDSNIMDLKTYSPRYPTCAAGFNIMNLKNILLVSGTIGLGTPSKHQKGHLNPIKKQS